jgi:hypothetical protein
MADLETTPRVSRVVAVLLVVALILGAVAVDRVDDGTAAPERAAATALAAAAIPRSATEVTSWYCAEGSSNPGGRADETLYLANIDDRPAEARVTVMAGEQVGTKQAPVTVPARSVVPVRVADVLAAPDPGVLVESTGGRTVVAHGLAGNSDVAIGPCASSPAPSWHFAAGNTGRGAQQWLALFNPAADDAIIDVSFLTDAGPVQPDALQGIVVPRGSRVAVPVHQFATRLSIVGTEVTSRRGQVVAEQSLSLDGTDGRKGLAVSLGAPAPARRWELATGLVGPGRTQQLVVANPGTDPVDVSVKIRLDGEAQLAAQAITVAPRTAVAVDLGLVPAGIGFSASVRAAAPVLVETLAATTTPNPVPVRGLESAMAQPAGARTWVLVPARASDRSNDFVAVLNPGTRPVSVHTAVLEGGTRRVLGRLGRATIAPGKRAVLDLRALEVPALAVLEVVGDGPVVVEREASGVPGLTLAAAVPDLR